MVVTWRRLVLVVGLALIAMGSSVGAAHAQSGGPHIVQPGENLFRIGLRYGVSVDDLMRANGLSNIYIYVGQALIIPGQAAPAPAPAANTAPVTNGAPVYYTVQPGETLFMIGLRYNLPWTKIQVANGLASDRVLAGQQLLIPLNDTAPAAAPTAAATATQPVPTPVATTAPATPAPATATPDPTTTPAPTEAAPAPAASPQTHTVQAGETLYAIGLKYNLRWTSIMAANNLAGEQIYPGQQLIIPAGDTAAPDPAAAPAAGQGPVAGMTGRYFLVDLSEQRLYAFEGDQLVRTTLISSGRWPYPTVTGTYHIYARYESTRMVGPGYDLPNVPYTQYFYQGYGLHGTYWHNNFGTPMSHGCVNMPTPEAEWAFNWASIGTTVIVQQ